MTPSVEPALRMGPRPLTHYALLSLAVAVGAFLMKLVAWRLTGSVGLLSDALESLASYAVEGVDTHALRTRQAAALKFMTVHLLMPGAWTIKQGNALAERLERDLRNAVPGLVVFTHLEPKEDPLSWKDGRLDRTSLQSLSPSLPANHPIPQCTSAT